jgi:hypothetical protein
MACVTSVVTNVELVVVHCFPVFNNPFEKETMAGERVTLFGALMTSHLALFKTL